jgi:DNA-directed RNA polymerase specialized sigma24 family protein
MTNTETLIDQHRPALVRYLGNRLGGNQELALDIAQATFAKVRENIHRLKPDANFTHWLYAIADNKGKAAKRALAA